MIIKKEQEKNKIINIFKSLRSKLFSKKKLICFLVILCLGVFLIGTVFGLILTGFFGTLDEPSELAVRIVRTTGIVPAMKHLQIIGQGLVHENIHIPSNIIKALLTPVEKIYLDIDYESYQKIQFKRDQALQIGYLESNDEDFVPAKIRFEEKTYDARLRLKGDIQDHYEGDKWSFRIKLKGDETIFGMKVFSIQDPETRNNIHELVFQELLRKEEVISLRTKLVGVVINGENKGVYQLQEHFDKFLIENNERREAPIIKFNENLVFERMLLNDCIRGRTEDCMDVNTEVYHVTDIDSFQTNKVLANEKLYKEYLKAKDLLELFRLGELKISEVFDIEKLAKYFAISQLTGSHHGLFFNNMRFYYNPVTSKLEPIGFDSNAGNVYLQPLYLEERLDTAFGNSFLDDMVFIEEFIQELHRISDEEYLNDFFRDFDESLENAINVYRRDNHWYYFSKSIYYKNQEYIRKLLNPKIVLKSYLNQKIDDYFVLEVANIHELPIKINSVLSANGTVFMPQETIILKSREQYQPEYTKIKFKIPIGYNIDDGSLKSLKIRYSLLGKNKLGGEVVYPWPRYDESTINDAIRQIPNIQYFDFVEIDSQEKKIIFPKGSWIISKDMIIPKDYIVLAEEDTTLNLVNNAKIISYSLLKFIGSEIKPIRIFSSDSSGGMLVLNTKKHSYLQHVSFENLRAPSENGWELTGAVTFNEADVSLKNCEFLNIDSEDALNIIHSNFVMDRVAFSNISSDCFDGDFTKGSIKSSYFESCGNDGADFSGSSIVIKDVHLNNIGDKAMSFGENSKASVKGIIINQSYIGVASKDLSSVSVSSTKIFDSDYGLAVYQKKSEFGSASINVNEGVKLFDVVVNYLEENGSSINGVVGKESQEKVYQKLYSKIS